MLADRVRMGSGKDSFNGVLYKDGVGGNLWTNTVNLSSDFHNEILQTTPFLEISVPSYGHFSDASPIATKEKYDLSRFNTIKIKYEMLVDGITDGIKEGVIDISSLSGDMYIIIAVGYSTRTLTMFISPSYIQNEVNFDFPYF